MSQDIRRLFSRRQVTDHLQEIEGVQGQIQRDYMEAVREFRNDEYRDSIRDIGMASEALIRILCEDHYDENEIPEKTGDQLNKLDKSDDGIPSYIGKSITPAYWLRNRASHPTEYEITQDDAHYALLCFQTAVEKYVREYLDADVF